MYMSLQILFSPEFLFSPLFSELYFWRIFRSSVLLRFGWDFPGGFGARTCMDCKSPHENLLISHFPSFSHLLGFHEISEISTKSSIFLDVFGWDLSHMMWRACCLSLMILGACLWDFSNFVLCYMFLSVHCPLFSGVAGGKTEFHPSVALSALPAHVILFKEYWSLFFLAARIVASKCSSLVRPALFVSISEARPSCRSQEAQAGLTPVDEQLLVRWSCYCFWFSSRWCITSVVCLPLLLNSIRELSARR